MDKWEYKILYNKFPTEVELNSLGEDGWELFVITRTSSGLRVIFKRRA